MDGECLLLKDVLLEFGVYNVEIWVEFGFLVVEVDVLMVEGII